MSASIRELIIQGLIIIIQIAAIALLPFVVNALKSFRNHLEAQMGKANYEKYSLIVKNIVYSMEQQYPDLLGPEKYKSVVYAINERLGGVLTEAEMNTLIEAAVAELNLISKGSIKKLSPPV
jgi:hypothetical protein